MVFGIWLPIFLVFNTVSGFMGINYHTDFNLPNSDSQFVKDALIKTGDVEDAGYTAEIVIASSDFLDQATQDNIKQLVEPFLAEVDKIDGVKVISPYSTKGKDFNNRLGGTSFAQISYTARSEAGTLSLANQIKHLGDTMIPPEARQIKCDQFRSHVRCELRIEYGGQLFAGFHLPETEILGLLAAVIILLIAFGSVLAMGLPIGTALFGLGVGAAVMAIASHGMTIPEFGPEVAAMIGLGVGIDYALFIVTRYREQLHAGMEPEEAVIRAVDSSGRAVIFAGITVIISLLGLFIVTLSFIRGLAVASSISVLLMMLASITLLPALLGFTGTKSTRRRGPQRSRSAPSWCWPSWVCSPGSLCCSRCSALSSSPPSSWPPVRCPSARACASSCRIAGPPRERQSWYRWSRLIQRHPWPPLLFGVS